MSIAEDRVQCAFPNASMLIELVVQNLVIVQQARLAPGQGLTVVSGETGAGKSLLLDALDLVLGGRGHATLVGRHGDAATVTAVFQAPPELHALIEKNCGVATQEGQIILRRRLAANGRSQCWINDVPVTVSSLQAAGRLLVEIRAQHESQGLADPARQLALLDAWSRTVADAEAYRSLHARCLECERTLNGLVTGERDSLKELEFLRFQAREFTELAPQLGELKSLEARHELLSGVEDWRARAAAAADALGEGDRAVVRILGQTARSLGDAPDERLVAASQACVQAGELAREAQAACLDAIERLVGDPQELVRVEERRNAYYDLMRKHGDSEQALLSAMDATSGRIAELEGLDERRSALEKERSLLQRERSVVGKRLAIARAAGFAKLAKEVAKRLVELGMPKTRLTLRAEDLTEPGPSGTVHQEILVSTNPGTPPGRLGEIASGGEAARISLAIAAAFAELDRIPVMVFDEVDSGVGGRLGGAIGAQLVALARDRTVIAVTHAPQVAACAGRHYAVRKIQGDDTTMVDVVEVAGEHRLAELAEMLGGGKAALGQARALIQGAGQ